MYRIVFFHLSVLNIFLKKGQNSDTCYNMAETGRHANCNKVEAKVQILYDSTYMRYGR